MTEAAKIKCSELGSGLEDGRQLLRQHDVASNLQLAAHEGLHRVDRVADQSLQRVRAQSQRAVRLGGCWARVHAATVALQIGGPGLLNLAASTDDVPLVHSTDFADHVWADLGLDGGEDLSALGHRRSSSRGSTGDGGTRSLNLALVGIKNRLQLLAQHDVACNLQLASHERLHWVQLAREDVVEVRISDSQDAVSLGLCRALAHRPGSVLQIQRPLTHNLALVGDVPLVHGTNRLDEIRSQVLGQLGNNPSSQKSGGWPSCLLGSHRPRRRWCASRVSGRERFHRLPTRLGQGAGIAGLGEVANSSPVVTHRLDGDGSCWCAQSDAVTALPTGLFHPELPSERFSWARPRYIPPHFISASTSPPLQ
eukprot:m.23033 g.23033  ORF g.23033 m.23033 type:complete len:367 (-) comp34562_c0_seq1:770-1870(-)